MSTYQHHSLTSRDVKSQCRCIVGEDNHSAFKLMESKPKVKIFKISYHEHNQRNLYWSKCEEGKLCKKTLCLRTRVYFFKITFIVYLPTLY